jgi:hypothetical protein
MNKLRLAFENYTLALLQKHRMAGSKHLMTGLLVVVVAVAFIYLVDPTFFGLLSLKQGFSDSGKKMTETYADMQDEISNGDNTSGGMNSGAPDVVNTYENPNSVGGDKKNSNPLVAEPSTSESFSDLASMEGPANFGSSGAPAGCYPRDQLTPGDLLPKDQNSVWAEQNPMGPGSLKGKNFLSAGALIGVNTVGQSLRNANYQLRSEPPNPQIPVSIFNQSTIAPDTNRRPLEIN